MSKYKVLDNHSICKRKIKKKAQYPCTNKKKQRHKHTQPIGAIYDITVYKNDIVTISFITS